MARLPYGTKSPETVIRYSLRAADELVDRGIKSLVVACNTAAAAALAAMRERYATLPVIGVIEPGAEAACAASVTGHIAVIATEGTVRGGAYQQAIARLRPEASVSAAACQLFVALAEEGWTDGPVAAAAAERYLAPLFRGGGVPPDTLVLGCTHFPALRPIIAAAAGPEVVLVDSAATTARAVRRLLQQAGLGALGEPSLHFLVTDALARFAHVGSRFLGRPIAPAAVELVDL
jgi:glutamate racemase